MPRTLMDSFEWLYGCRPTFGLVNVERETFVRSPKPTCGTNQGEQGAFALIPCGRIIAVSARCCRWQPGLLLAGLQAI